MNGTGCPGNFPAGVRAQDIKNVFGIFNQKGAVFYQFVGAGGTLVGGKTGNGKNVTSLFQCQPGGYQRTGMQRSFDDQCAVGESGNNAVTAGKVACRRFGSERKFGNNGTLPGNLFAELLVFGGIGDINAGSEDGNGASGAVQGEHCAFVCRGIDAARHAGDNHNPLRGQLTGNLRSQFTAVERGVAGSDD